MRPGLLLLLIGIPGAAMATEDRYGPARRPDPVLTQTSSSGPDAASSSYTGPLLNWSGRPAAATPSPAAAPAPVQAPAPPGRVVVASAPVPQSPASLPTGLYDGAAASAPAPSPANAPANAPAAPTTVASAPPVASTAAYGSPWGDYRPRAYSVVREYGGTPDRIQAPPPQSAFTGPEISLEPGLLGSSPDNTPPENDGADDQPVRRPAKDSK